MPTQLEWYKFARRYVRGKSVLDVGCGLGDGLRILQEEAVLAEGQDLDPRLARSDVKIVDISEIPDQGYDVVTSMDVIEHVEDPPAFLRHLARIARVGFFLTTPNWTASRCHWPFHLREYTPREFAELLRPVGDVVLFKGTCSGSVIHEVRHPLAYYRLNDFRNWWPTALLTRCVNRLLPSPFKIHSSNAAWVHRA